METKSVDVVLSRPGIYIMVTDVMLAFCEVDHDGACHQLRPRDFARDGELRPGRWNLPAGITFYGPLARCEPGTTDVTAFLAPQQEKP